MFHKQLYFDLLFGWSECYFPYLPLLQGTAASQGFSLLGGTATVSPTHHYETILESCLIVNSWELFLDKTSHLTLSSGRWHSIKYLL